MCYVAYLEIEPCNVPIQCIIEQCLHISMGWSHIRVMSSSYCRMEYSRVQARTPCQHTSCRACFLLVRANCTACPEPPNKKCLRRYHECVRDHYHHSAIDDVFLVRENKDYPKYEFWCTLQPRPPKFKVVSCLLFDKEGEQKWYQGVRNSQTNVHHATF